MCVGPAYLAGRGWSVGVSPSFVAADSVITDTSLLAAVCLKLIYHFSISLVLDGSPPSALLTLFGSLVLQCLSALMPYRTGPGVLPIVYPRPVLYPPSFWSIGYPISLRRSGHTSAPVASRWRSRGVSHERVDDLASVVLSHGARS